MNLFWVFLDIEEIRDNDNETWNRFERGRRNRNWNYSAPFVCRSNSLCILLTTLSSNTVLPLISWLTFNISIAFVDLAPHAGVNTILRMITHFFGSNCSPLIIKCPATTVVPTLLPAILMGARIVVGKWQTIFFRHS